MTVEAQKLAATGSVGAGVGAMVKDAFISALLTFGLCFPVVLLHAESDNDGNLYLIPRPLLVAVLCGLVFVGRLGISFYRARPKAEPRRVAVAPRPMSDWQLLGRYGNLIASILGLAFLFLFPLVTLWLLGPAGSLKWINNYGIQILIYVMLGWGLNVVVGLAGLLDLGYVAFYALGAYSYALLSTTFGLSFWICLPLAGILAAFWGVILGFPVLRLRGDYLAIVTLAFGEIIRMILVNWVPVTGGYAGIASIPKVTFFGIPFADEPGGFADTFHIEYSPIHRTIFLFYLILCLALLTNFVTRRLRRLPIGRAWEALREDEIACRSLGINTRNTKLTAFSLGALFGGFAGSFFAVRQGFVSPESFTFIESATILAIVVLGGMGSQLGVALAAVVMIGGTEILREMEWTKQIFGRDFDPAQYRMLIFGMGMVIMMVVRPRGIVSTRMPSIFLKERKAVSGDLVKEGHG
jgi:branched-chain amino acid transport system permease protein